MPPDEYIIPLPKTNAFFNSTPRDDPHNAIWLLKTEQNLFVIKEGAKKNLGFSLEYESGSITKRMFDLPPERKGRASAIINLFFFL
jgi:hypothetical protein